MANVSNPQLISSLSRMIDAKLAAVHVSMPAKIISYNSAKQRAVVQPVVRRYYTSEEGVQIAEKLPAIEGVPVTFLGAGEYSLTFPLAAGVTGLLVFGECSLDKWLTTGASDVDPDDPRRNALSDAMFYPGLRSFADATAQVADDAMVIGAPEVRIGSKDADQATLKGDDYISAESAWLDDQQAFNAAVATALSGLGAPVAAQATAIAEETITFKAAGSAAKSSKVKVE